jgi:hypothetical protein
MLPRNIEDFGSSSSKLQYPFSSPSLLLVYLTKRVFPLNMMGCAAGCAFLSSRLLEKSEHWVAQNLFLG